MKKLFVAICICLCTAAAFAQPEMQDTTADTGSNTYIDNSGEAGGVTDTSIGRAEPGFLADNWLYLALGAVVIAVASSLITKALLGNKNKTIAEEEIIEEEQIATTQPKTKEPKTTAADVKKLKLELKEHQQQLQKVTAAYNELDKQFEAHRNFDKSYFNEAFKKLVVPMGNALESGNRKDITETTLKMMMHYSSLTRYKIAKKQPFDEHNIHYLLNQKGNADASVVEINGATPIDKIPKNIKTLIDLLKESGSQGLDDSVVAGYKIKNL